MTMTGTTSNIGCSVGRMEENQVENRTSRKKPEREKKQPGCCWFSETNAPDPSPSADTQPISRMA